MTHSMAGVTVSSRKWYAGGDLLVSTDPSASSTAIKTIKFAELIGLLRGPSKSLLFQSGATITHISAADLEKASKPTAGTGYPVKVILDNLLAPAGVFLDCPDPWILGRDGTSIRVLGENSLGQKAPLISIADRSATATAPTASAAATATAAGFECSTFSWVDFCSHCIAARESGSVIRLPTKFTITDIPASILEECRKRGYPPTEDLLCLLIERSGVILRHASLKSVFVPATVNVKADARTITISTPQELFLKVESLPLITDEYQLKHLIRKRSLLIGTSLFALDQPILICITPKRELETFHSWVGKRAILATDTEIASRFGEVLQQLVSESSGMTKGKEARFTAVSGKGDKNGVEVRWLPKDRGFLLTPPKGTAIAFTLVERPSE